MNKSTKLLLTVHGFDEAPHQTTWGDFIAENDLSEEEREDLERALIDRGQAWGGGGAMPEWSLTDMEWLPE